MKQVIQSRRTGRLALKDVPAPQLKPGHVLVRTRASLISAGTERMVMDFAKKSLAGKAKARPDLVKKVIDKAKRDGIKTTFQTVMARLDEPLPLGYSAAGEIISVGVGLEGIYAVGQRVAMAGSGIGNHAEVNAVPENLLAPVPDDVTDEAASFATLGAIAMHAVRNLDAGLGDVVAVLGCGLVGQLTAQFLTLSGVRVVALDYDSNRLKLAVELGAELACNLADDGLTAAVREITSGRGCDGIIIAAATDSSEPFETAAALARDRARVVMVGLTGTAFPYADYMKKELHIIVSRSYGPGRYDTEFEDQGLKYPVGWIRWTERENLAETLRLMSPARAAHLDVAALISHRFSIDVAECAFGLVTGGGEPHLGVILYYSNDSDWSVQPNFVAGAVAARTCMLGAIGAGNFARSVLFPEVKAQPGSHLHTIVTQRGPNAVHSKETFGFDHAETNPTAIFENPAINAVMISTRHTSHSAFTTQALDAGKHVLVEKPLALDWDGLNAVVAAREANDGVFFQVGFNRRFAPAAERLRDGLAGHSGPKVIQMRINAGAIEAKHWVHSASEGGGRLLGEACHFIDLARFLVAHPIAAVCAEAAQVTDGASDDATIALRFADGSIANIVYTARGNRVASKERIEAHAGGASYILEDFRSLEVMGDNRTAPWKGRQDKGFKGAIAAFISAVTTGGPAPIDEVELIETSASTIAVLDSLRTGERINL